MHEYAIGPLLEVVKGSVDDLECVKLAVFAVGTLSEVRIFESLMLLRLLLLLVVMVLVLLPYWSGPNHSSLALSALLLL